MDIDEIFCALCFVRDCLTTAPFLGTKVYGAHIHNSNCLLGTFRNHARLISISNKGPLNIPLLFLIATVEIETHRTDESHGQPNKTHSTIPFYFAPKYSRNFSRAIGSRVFSKRKVHRKTK